MKRIKKTKLLTAGIFACCGPADLVAPPSPTSFGAAPVAEDLTFIRQEEKLARDVYLTLGEKWGLAVFAAIAKSEQLHMDIVALLLYQVQTA